MISCSLMGGLGNQLFQIFATMSHGIQNRQPYRFLRQERLGNRRTAWDTLLRGLQHVLINSFPPNITIVREQYFTHNELPVILNKNVSFLGYYQSEKYFKSNYAHIYKILDIELRRDELKQKLLVPFDETQTTVSMHFRIGDYKNIQQCHPLMPLAYYAKALKHIQSSIIEYAPIQVVYFCEDVDLEEVLEMVEQLTIQFPNYIFVRCNPELADWEQLLYMSFCNHNIIANSSFSWWGAYFNPLKEKIVCYPSNWFGPGVVADTQDLCPPEWVRI